jgi:hypothetical protein
VALSTPTGAGNVTTASSGAGSTITLTKPANIADGDLLVAALYWRNASGSPTAPAGWTLMGVPNTTYETFGLWSKPIPTAAGEPADYAWSTTTGTQRIAGVMFRALGVNLSAVQDSYGSLAAYTGTASVVLPAVTTIAADTLLVGYAINNGVVTGSPSAFTGPGSMTTLGSVSADNGTSATSAIWVGSQVLSAAGATGTRTVTMSPSAANSGGIMVALTGIPAATSPPDLGPPQTVNSQATVTINATITGTVTAWVWTQTDGPTVTLSGSGASRNFPAPETVDGTSVTVEAVATIGGVDSPAGSVVISVRAHQWWVQRTGVWQPFENPVIVT